MVVVTAVVVVAVLAAVVAVFVTACVAAVFVVAAAALVVTAWGLWFVAAIPPATRAVSPAAPAAATPVTVRT